MSRWDELRAVFTDVFKFKTHDEWTAVFAGSDACATPVLAFGEVLDEKHITERATFYETPNGLQPMPAPRFSRSGTEEPQMPDVEGVDPRAVLTCSGEVDSCTTSALLAFSFAGVR